MESFGFFRFCFEGRESLVWLRTQNGRRKRPILSTCLQGHEFSRLVEGLFLISSLLSLKCAKGYCAHVRILFPRCVCCRVFLSSLVRVVFLLLLLTEDYGHLWWGLLFMFWEFTPSNERSFHGHQINFPFM